MMSEPGLRELEADALLGELARPLTHEFNNFLNTLLLQFAIFERDLPPALRERTSAIRKEAKAIASHIREWQRYKKDNIESSGAIDLHEIIREVLTEHEDEAVLIDASYSETPAMVQASPVDLKRLCGIIVNNAMHALGKRAGGKIAIQSRVTPSEVLLVIQDNREGMATEDVATWFDIRPERNSARALEMAACQAIMRRLRGAIEAQKGPADELAIHLKLPRGAM